MRALNEAGLLGTGGTASGAAGVIGVLSEAGLLRTGAASGPSEPPAAPPEGPQVGDVVSVGGTRLKQVSKFAREPGAAIPTRVQLVQTLQGRNTFYDLVFPPNDDSYLAEIDKLTAAPRPPTVFFIIKLTSEISADYYRGELIELQVHYMY